MTMQGHVGVGQGEILSTSAHVCLAAEAIGHGEIAKKVEG